MAEAYAPAIYRYRGLLGYGQVAPTTPAPRSNRSILANSPLACASRRTVLAPAFKLTLNVALTQVVLVAVFGNCASATAVAPFTRILPPVVAVEDPFA